MAVCSLRARQSSKLDVLTKVADSVFGKNWREEYEKSATWSPIWVQCHQPSAQWPTDVQLRGESKQFMYLRGRLCVPEGLSLLLVHEWHNTTLGHCGVKKMEKDLSARFDIPGLKNLVQGVRKGCQVCQVTDKPNWSGPGQWRSTPVPPYHLMDIAMDVVHIEEYKTWDGKLVDSCLVVVDRHSGWVMAYLVLNRGLQPKQLHTGRMTVG